MKEAPTWRLFIPRDLMFYDGISRSFSHDDSTPTVVVRLIGLCFGNPTSMVPDARPLFSRGRHCRNFSSPVAM
jgi:hypothetical protein